MPEPATSESGETQWLALRWSARALRMVLAVVTASALGAYAVLLNVIIRNVPAPASGPNPLPADRAAVRSIVAGISRGIT